MLTEVRADSAWGSEPALTLHLQEDIVTDTLQLRHIDGIDPADANVGSTPYGSVDGSSYHGGTVPTRNIVLTIGTNPDWATSTHSELRMRLLQYFIPKRISRLVFYSDTMVPVEISGVVEKVSINIFSKDPEVQVSIICHDPHFTAIEPVVVTGRTGSEPTVIAYGGSLEAGINVKIVTDTTEVAPSEISVQMGNPEITRINIATSINSLVYFELSSLPLRKFVQDVYFLGGEILNRLAYVHDTDEDAMWPQLFPGDNTFYVITDVEGHHWTLTYYERFGSL